MSKIEMGFLAGGIFLYAASFICGTILSQTRKAAFLLLVGILLQASSAGIRWYYIGHPPVFGTYEATLAASWFILLYTAASYTSIHCHFKILSLTTIPISILIILYGLTFNINRIPLTITERSLWVDFHALFSWIAFGSYAAAACLAGVCLWQGASGRKQEVLEPEVLDDLIFRYINFGFINHTVMFALGSYYSSILYGNWWQWDPVNSTSLITWLAYGLAIHMRLFYRWRGKRWANLATVCFLTAVASYWGLIYFPPGSTYHVFDIELKIH